MHEARDRVLGNAGLTGNSGISQSRLRFLALEFADLLGITNPGTHNLRFDESQLQTIRILNRLFFDERKPAASVRIELGKMRPSRTARVITVTSGKGGVGKTTVSVNLATAMGHSGLKTLLVDADMGLGNVHVLAGVDGRKTVAELVPGGATIEALLVDGPTNVKILCAGSGMAKQADMDERTLKHISRELDRIAPLFDVILIDTGAGIASQVVHFLRMAQDIVLVTTPDLAAVLDAYGVIKVGREAGVDGTFRVLVNCADSVDEAKHVFDRIGGCAQRFLGFTPELLGHVKRDDVVRNANQRRRPLVQSHPNAIASRAFAGLAGKLAGDLMTKKSAVAEDRVVAV